MARHAKLNNPPRIARDRERAEHALIKVEKGYMLKRDPDGGNRQPIGEGASLPRRPVREMWAELAMVKVPDHHRARRALVTLSRLRPSSG